MSSSSDSVSLASSCLWGGYEDQLDAGVITSQAMSLSVSNAAGVAKLFTWRLLEPAPRSSTGTPDAGPYRNGRRRAALAPGSAITAASSLVSVTVDAIGRYAKSVAASKTP